MKPYAQLTPAERAGEYAGLKAEWDALKAQGRQLNMARASPASSSWTWSATFSA